MRCSLGERGFVGDGLGPLPYGRLGGLPPAFAAPPVALRREVARRMAPARVRIRVRVRIWRGCCCSLESLVALVVPLLYGRRRGRGRDLLRPDGSVRFGGCRRRAKVVGHVGLVVVVAVWLLRRRLRRKGSGRGLADRHCPPSFSLSR